MAEACTNLLDATHNNNNNLQYHRLLPHELCTSSSPSSCSTSSSSNLHNRAEPQHHLLTCNSTLSLSTHGYCASSATASSASVASSSCTTSSDHQLHLKYHQQQSNINSITKNSTAELCTEKTNLASVRPSEQEFSDQISSQISKVARYGDRQDIAAVVNHSFENDCNLNHNHFMPLQAAASMAASTSDGIHASAAFPAASAPLMNMINNGYINSTRSSSHGSLQNTSAAGAEATNSLLLYRNSFLYNGLVSSAAPAPLMFPGLNWYSNGSQYQVLQQQHNAGCSLFTSDQWSEFTLQTLIYKHLAMGISPPADLVLPIIRSVQTARMIGLGLLANGINSPALLHHLNIGGFYPLRGNVDPEPGRCRRTDGKKWRCSKDVVTDQKYCERHIHRGRHRSRAKKQQLINQQQQLNVTANSVSNSKEQPNVKVNINSNNAATSYEITPTCSGSIKHNSESNRSTCSNTDQSMASTSCYNTDLRRQLLIAQSQRNSNNFFDYSLINRNNIAAAEHQMSSSDQLTLDMLKMQQSAPIYITKPSTISLSCPNMGNALSLEQDDMLNHQLRAMESNINSNTDIGFHQNQRSPGMLSLSMAARSCGSDAELASCVNNSSVHDQVMNHTDDQNVSKPFINWVPISWDTANSNAIGGPLAEAFQSTIGSGIRKLELPTNMEADIADAKTEYESHDVDNELGSWVHHHHQQTRFSSPPADTADHHHHHHSKHNHSVSNLASPTGVLQIKAAFGSCTSESSSTASSPRSAIKLLDSSQVISLHSAHHLLSQDEDNNIHNSTDISLPNI